MKCLAVSESLKGFSAAILTWLPLLWRPAFRKVVPLYFRRGVSVQVGLEAAAARHPGTWK